MKNRWRELGLVATLVAVGACSGGEAALIDSYFKTSNARDVRGLEKIASFQFEETVDAWTVVGMSDETRAPVTLPDLMKRYETVKAELDVQKEKSSRYALEHLSDVEKVKTLLGEEKEIPSALEEVAAAWQELSGREEELKSAAAEALDAVQREKQICQISAGEASDLTTSAGEVLSKEVELSLTIGGEAKPYVMTLRRYMLEETDTPHEISRWMVYDLKPKG